MRKLKLLIVAGIVSIMVPATPVCAFEQIFAQCSEYINIRQDATTDSDVIAKIYNNLIDIQPNQYKTLLSL